LVIKINCNEIIANFLSTTSVAQVQQSVQGVCMTLSSSTRHVIIIGTPMLLCYNVWINRYKLAIFIHKP